MKMTSRPQLSITVVLLYTLIVLLSSNVFTATCQPDTTIDDYYCSPETYAPDSPYAAEIDAGLDELTYGTDSQPQYQFSLVGVYAAGFAYCQLRLSADDCVVCLEHANQFLREDCQYSKSAYVVMLGCGIRYVEIPSPSPSPNPSDDDA